MLSSNKKKYQSTTGRLTVKNLIKNYGKIRAVDNISFHIEPGICFGLLGPNGAGKTTTIEIIEGITQPTSGHVLYNNAPRNRTFWERIGVQFQSTELFAFLTVRESLQTFMRLYRNQVKLDDLIRMCSLEAIQHQDNRKISGGQKQRLMLAIALANNPDLIFLDEPTTGLDPQSRRHLWEIVETIKRKGKTIVLTTHYMEEAQVLCDEIIIVDKGKIIAQGPPEELITRKCAGQIIRLPQENVPEHIRQMLDLNQDFAWHLDATQKFILIQSKTINDCIELLMNHKVDLSRLTIRPHNLEDLFLQLTGKTLRH